MWWARRESTGRRGRRSRSPTAARHAALSPTPSCRLQAIFDRLRDPKYSQSSVTASYLEIYNEELSDLLLDAPLEVGNTTARGGFGGGATKDAKKELKMVEDVGSGKQKGKGMYVHNLSEHVVTTTSDVLGLIQRAQERRRVGETKMNKHSSRSHCVFTLTVSSTRATSDTGMMECSGKLNLVDLAGSECAKTAGGGAADGRERERKNINQSLLTLGRVISMLRNRSEGGSDRIPYRDSKLTRLLQESLGGRCKTLLICTLSPSILAVEETHSSLTYAQSAQGITNKATATSYIRCAQPASQRRAARVATPRRPRRPLRGSGSSPGSFDRPFVIGGWPQRHCRRRLLAGWPTWTRSRWALRRRARAARAATCRTGT